MRVHRDRLVGPFEHRRIARMIGIEADMAALDLALAEPVLDHPQLGWAVAILAVDLGMDSLVEAEDRIGADAVIESQPFGDLAGIEAVAGGGHHHASPFGLVAGDGRSSAG